MHRPAKQNEMRVAITAVVALAVGILSLDSRAASPNWTEWDKANAVAQKKQWLVIREPNQGFCYIRQGYDGYSDRMDLSMKKDGIPYLTTPFSGGIEGGVSYQVDDGAVRTVPDGDISTTIVRLSPDVVPELRRGLVLTVRVTPDGRRTFEQKFDLRGFTAASNMFGSAICREKVPDQYSP